MCSYDSLYYIYKSKDFKEVNNYNAHVIFNKKIWRLSTLLYIYSKSAIGSNNLLPVTEIANPWIM